MSNAHDNVSIIVFERAGITVVQTNFVPVGGSGGGGGPLAWSDILDKPSLLVSGSLIPSSSYSTFAASARTAISSSYAPATPADFATLTNKPALLVSGSFIPSSSVATSSSFAAISPFAGLVGLPVIFSGSQQVQGPQITGIVPSASVAQSTNTAVSSSYATQAGNAQTAVSSSWAPGVGGGTTWSAISSIPVGLVSQSIQIDYTGIQNKPTTIATAVSSSYALNAGLATLATTASFQSNNMSTLNLIVANAGGIGTGYQGSIKFPANMYLNEVALLAGQSGSVSVDLRKMTQGTFGTGLNAGSSITGSTPLSMSNNQTFLDSTLTSYARSFTTGDILNCYVTSTSGSAFSRFTLALTFVKV